CNVTGGTNPGLVDGTCTSSGTDGSNSYAIGDLSNAVLRPNRSIASSFFGKLTAGDSVNTSDDGSGEASFPANPLTFDWFNFENAFRGWGIGGSAFPNFDHTGRWSAGTGKIWDWRLLSTDNNVFNRTGD